MANRIKRLVKHLWLGGESATHRAIAPVAVKRLKETVARSERRHCGEIRIFVESALPLADLMRRDSTPMLARNRALSMFGELRIWDTAGNNGVLIYVLLIERRIEIVADRGVNDLVDNRVWQAMVTQMGGAFAAGRFEEGLQEAVSGVTALLEQHFPLTSGQRKRNELPDTPVLG